MTTNSSPPYRATMSPGPDGLGHRPRDAPQDRVADGVAVVVVDLAEPVEVEDDQAQVGAAPGGAGERGLDRLVEVASVEEPGQRVADRGLAHARMEVGVVQGDLDLRHEQVGDAQVELGERAIGALAGRREHRAASHRRAGSAAPSPT